MADDDLTWLRGVLEALAGRVSIEPHGSGEALYLGRTDPPPGSFVGGHHGLNIVHLTDPAHQWPEVRQALTAIGSLWPELLAVVEAATPTDDEGECPGCGYDQIVSKGHHSPPDEPCPVEALHAAIRRHRESPGG